MSLAAGSFCTLEPIRRAPWESGRKFIAQLEGFATAAAAETAGRRLALALLWTATKLDIPIRLEYTSYEPVAVFQRGSGLHVLAVSAYAHVSHQAAQVLETIQNAYAELAPMDAKLLLSMEIYCASRLIESERAMFLSLVSALEPLAAPACLGDDVARIVDHCIDAVSATHLEKNVKSPLVQRLNQLRTESIRQALFRLVRNTLPGDPDALRIVDDAYNLRSQIAHSGRPDDLDVDLESEARTVSELIRNIYANLLHQDLTT